MIADASFLFMMVACLGIIGAYLVRRRAMLNYATFGFLSSAVNQGADHLAQPITMWVWFVIMIILLLREPDLSEEGAEQ